MAEEFCEDNGDTTTTLYAIMMFWNPFPWVFWSYDAFIADRDYIVYLDITDTQEKTQIISKNASKKLDSVFVSQNTDASYNLYYYNHNTQYTTRIDNISDNNPSRFVSYADIAALYTNCENQKNIARDQEGLTKAIELLANPNFLQSKYDYRYSNYDLKFLGIKSQWQMSALTLNPRNVDKIFALGHILFGVLLILLAIAALAIWASMTYGSGLLVLPFITPLLTQILYPIWVFCNIPFTYIMASSMVFDYLCIGIIAALFYPKTKLLDMFTQGLGYFYNEFIDTWIMEPTGLNKYLLIPLMDYILLPIINSCQLEVSACADDSQEYKFKMS
jgi:hypothetical protein